MEGLLVFLIFLGKFLLVMFLIGFPLLLLIVFIADKVYKKVGPKYEELRRKRIEELEGRTEDRKKKKA